MQDGAPSHYASITRNYLYRIFSKERVILRGCNIPWSPRSPDLNSIDYWFWRTLKARLFNNDAPKDLTSLKDRINEVCNEITIDEISSAISNLNQRMQLLENALGGHFEHLL